MSFLQRNLYRVENIGLRPTFTVYTYINLSDTIAAMTTANYFSAEDNPRYTLKENDVINVQASDGYAILSVLGDGESAQQVLAQSYTPPANLIAINQESDFPTQDGTTITLETGNFYEIGASFSTAKYFMVEPNTGFTMNSLASDVVLTYTGTGAMFRGTDVERFDCRDFRINAPSGLYFDFKDVTSPNTSVFNCANFLTGATNAGYMLFEDMGAVVIDNGGSDGFANPLGGPGIEFSGSNYNTISLTRLALVGNTTTNYIVDLGAVTSTNIEIDNSFFVQLNAGAIECLNGAANGANLAAGFKGTITNTLFSSAAGALSGIEPNDVTRWVIANNSGVIDGLIKADTFLTTDVTVTNVGIGVYTPIAGGQWDSTELAGFTADVNGLLTSVLEETVPVTIDGTISCSTGGFLGDQIGLRISINGTTLARTESVGDNNLAGSFTLTCSAVVNIAPADTIQLEITNFDSGTNDPDVLTANLNVRR